MAQRRGLDENERREARRQALRSAALEMFATRGYLASPIEDLCRAAHVSTKSFYGIYSSREECYLDLMSSTNDWLLTSMGEAVAAEGFSDVAAAERRLIEAFAQLMTADPRIPVALFGRGTVATFAVESERRATRRRAAGLVSAIWSQSNLPADPPDGVATGVVGGLFDIVADWVADAEDLATLDASALESRLIAFYTAVTQGLREGKGLLS